MDQTSTREWGRLVVWIRCEPTSPLAPSTPRGSRSRRSSSGSAAVTGSSFFFSSAATRPGGKRSKMLLTAASPSAMRQDRPLDWSARERSGAQVAPADPVVSTPAARSSSTNPLVALSLAASRLANETGLATCARTFCSTCDSNRRWPLPAVTSISTVSPTTSKLKRTSSS